MDVHIWHGQNRFNLHEALYPDEVECIDVDDNKQEEIESHSDTDGEDVDMADEPASEAGENDDEEWKPKIRSRVTKTKAKKDRKKIQVVVTSYGVLASEHAKHERSVRKPESSVFESTFTISTRCLITYHSNQSNGSGSFWMKPTIVNPALAKPPKRSVR